MRLCPRMWLRMTPSATAQRLMTKTVISRNNTPFIVPASFLLIPVGSLHPLFKLTQLRRQV
jgi:hypothetical protein